MRAALLAAVILLPLLRSAAAAAPEIAVDPRLELLGVVQRLAGRETFPPEDADYARAVDERFGRWRGHPAVRLYADLAANSADPLGVILLHYSNPPELALKDPEAAVPFAATERGGEQALSFLWQLRDFAAVSGFAEFFRDNQPRYRSAESAARAELGTLDPEAAIGRYAGLDLQVRRHYALSLLYTPSLRNSYIIPYPEVAALGRHDGPFDVWTIFQYFAGKEARDRAGIAAFKVPSPELWQESLFVFVEPALYSFENLAPFDPAVYYGSEIAACRGDRRNCVKSGLISALLDRLGGGGPPPPVVKPDYAGALRARLEEYEAHRDLYPTLWGFMPRLLSVYSEIGTGRPAPNPLAGAKVPEPRKISDFFSPGMLTLAGSRRGADAQEPAAAARPAVCADFSVDAAVRLAAASDPALASRSGEIQRAAMEYYRCRAYAAGDSVACLPLKAYRGTTKDGTDVFDMCEAQSREMARFRALIAREPGFPALCRRGVGRGDMKDFSEADGEKVCAAMLRLADRPEALCAELGKLSGTPEFRKRCEPLFRVMNGDESAMAGIKNSAKGGKGRYLEYAAFSRAFAAKDARVCGESLLCRQFMGAGPDVCEAYAARVKREICRE